MTSTTPHPTHTARTISTSVTPAHHHTHCRDDQYWSAGGWAEPPHSPPHTHTAGTISTGQLMAPHHTHTHCRDDQYWSAGGWAESPHPPPHTHLAGTISTGQLVAGLRHLGFDQVFDTDFSADLTIMEEVGGGLQTSSSCRHHCVTHPSSYHLDEALIPATLCRIYNYLSWRA